MPTSWTDLVRPEFPRRLASPGIDNTHGLHTLAMMARTNGDAMCELFRSGEIWLALWGSSRAAAMVEAGFTRPREGGVVLMTAACAVEGRPNPELVQKVVSRLVPPAVQQAFAARNGAGPTNRAARLPPAIAAKVVHGEEQVKGLVSMDWDTINRDRMVLARLFAHMDQMTAPLVAFVAAALIAVTAALPAALDRFHPIDRLLTGERRA